MNEAQIPGRTESECANEPGQPSSNEDNRFKFETRSGSDVFALYRITLGFKFLNAIEIHQTPTNVLV